MEAKQEIPGEDEPRFVNPATGKALTAAELEKKLLKELEEAAAEYRDSLYRLALFQLQVKRQPEAAVLNLDRLISVADDLEQKAFYCLKMGQMLEQQDNYEGAAQAYARGMGLEPADRKTWYFINNNLGYCLNRLGRHEEAEKYCRAAVGIDPQIQNAYKNLGISLQGQGLLRDAAGSFVEAVRRNPFDARALLHLEALLKENPALLQEDPHLVQALEECRLAVANPYGMKDN